MQTCINRIEQDNNHTQIIQKMQFRSSFSKKITNNIDSYVDNKYFNIIKHLDLLIKFQCHFNKYERMVNLVIIYFHINMFSYKYYMFSYSARFQLNFIRE